MGEQTMIERHRERECERTRAKRVSRVKLDQNKDSVNCTDWLQTESRITPLLILSPCALSDLPTLNNVLPAAVAVRLVQIDCATTKSLQNLKQPSKTCCILFGFFWASLTDYLLHLYDGAWEWNSTQIVVAQTNVCFTGTF